jgi:hypothetical protein
MKDSTKMFVGALALGFVGSTEARKRDCSNPAQYEIEIFDTFTSTNHPVDFDDGHFSPSLAVAHDSNFALWGPGFLATDGVKSVAETGSTTDIEAEIAAYSQFTHMTDKLSGPFFLTDEAVSEKLPQYLNVEVTESFPYVSTIHMLAPSPDWFTGVRNVNLCDDKGNWVKKYEVTSQPYDAGTDCGVSYTSDNCVESPPLRVHSITPATTTTGDNGPLFVKDGAVAPVTTWTFNLVDDDSKPKPKPKAKAILRGSN